MCAFIGEIQNPLPKANMALTTFVPQRLGESPVN